MKVYLKERLKEYNLKNPKQKLTQEALAKVIGISYQTLINLRKSPPESIVYYDKICTTLNITHEQLKTK